MAQPRIAIILGGGKTVWDDLEKTINLIGDEPFHSIGCNHAARDVDGPLDHFVTMHSELLGKWIETRRAAGQPEAGRLWVAEHRAPAIPSATRIKSPGGSSGLLCVVVGLHLGFSRMILCGVPMNANDAHYDRPRKWIEARQYWPAWERALPLMRGKVKSWGGQTARLLGVPDREWLNGDIGHATPPAEIAAG